MRSDIAAIAEVVYKALWVLSNLYAEKDIACTAFSLDRVKQFCDLMTTVRLNLQSDCHRLCTEILWVLANLITECDQDQVLQAMQMDQIS